MDSVALFDAGFHMLITQNHQLMLVILTHQTSAQSWLHEKDFSSQMSVCPFILCSQGSSQPNK